MPKAPSSYLNDNFPKAWDRADVNRTGRIDPARAATMIREVVADPVVGFGLQLQKGQKPKQALVAAKAKGDGDKEPKVEYKPR